LGGDAGSPHDATGYRLWIRSLHLSGEPSADQCHFVIAGFRWQCLLTIKQDVFRVLLQDQEMPRLHPR